MLCFHPLFLLELLSKFQTNMWTEDEEETLDDFPDPEKVWLNIKNKKGRIVHVYSPPKSLK